MISQNIKSISEKKVTRPRNTRLIGIDLFRGISAYAVILYHSGDRTWGNISVNALLLRDFFGFAVPFFLATSFLFLTQRAVMPKAESGASLWALLKQKSRRIVKPYLTWTVVFLIFRLSFFTLTNDSEALRNVFDDPLSIIFLGGASYQLYFLPLLLSGIFTYLLLEQFFREWAVRKTILFLLFSIVLRGLILTSNNDFDLGTYQAFQSFSDELSFYDFPLVRLVLIYIAWASRCLPYIFCAILINLALLRGGGTYEMPFGSSTVLFVAVIFIVVNYWDGRLFLVTAFEDQIIAFSLILVGIFISQRADLSKYSGLISNLRNCSLGIYLVHPIIIRSIVLVIEIVNPALTHQVTIMSILSISVPSFLMSWMLINQFREINCSA